MIKCCAILGNDFVGQKSQRTAIAFFVAVRRSEPALSLSKGRSAAWPYPPHKHDYSTPIVAKGDSLSTPDPTREPT